MLTCFRLQDLILFNKQAMDNHKNLQHLNPTPKHTHHETLMYITAKTILTVIFFLHNITLTTFHQERDLMCIDSLPRDSAELIIPHSVTRS